MSGRLAVDFAGIPMKNPVALASGTCGFGRELSEYFDLERLGGISVKGLTIHPREGNEGIRVWETPSGMMNSVGLENPGVEGFITSELPRLQALDLAVIVNLSGFTIEDYLAGMELLEGKEFDILELNISCPNIKAGGMSFGVKAQTAGEAVRQIRRVCKHKLMVKLSPNAEDIASVAKACEEAGADALSLVNTFLALAVDVKKKKPVFNNIYAGLSGPAIKPIALRMVHQVAKAVSIPVMGMGGITTWQDAAEFVMAGASAVQVGTATFIKPDIAIDIINGLEDYLKSEGVSSISEIKGII